MKSVLFATAITLSLTTTQAILADSVDNRKVQKYLLAAGFDPNGVDGNIGPGTKRAASNFASTISVSLPELTDKTAPMWREYFERQQAERIDFEEVCSPIGIMFDNEGVSSPFYGNHRGLWDNGVEHHLMVTSVQGKEAEGFYAAGEPFNSCFMFDEATIENNQLTLRWSDYGIKVTYEAADDKLAGSYTEPGVNNLEGTFYPDEESQFVGIE